MKSLQDAIYNWLTIKVVSDARPDDLAAMETKDMFEEMLKADYGVADLSISKDDSMYHVAYIVKEENQQKRFPVELVEILLEQINGNPDMYKIYPADE